MDQKIWKIATIGDSLTEGNGRGAKLSPEPHIPNMYQSYLYYYLKEKGYSTEIWNHGIGGQVVSEICTRLPNIVPADIIVVMAGTNDTWRYSGYAPGIEEEMAEDIIDWYKNSVPKTIENQKALGKQPPIILVHSIPPIGNVKTVPLNMCNCILHVNNAVKKMISNWNLPNVHYCDIHQYVAGSDKYMLPGLTVPDGVHFTIDGNKAVGEAIAKNVLNFLPN
jgi:lysophospholipase L1-like esterase